MKALKGNTTKQSWIRFIVGGGFNTVFTYLVYFALNEVAPYQIAYLIAYASGIIFAYWFNSKIVFQVQITWRGLATYPVVYVLQYLASAILLDRFIEFFSVSEALAPLLVTTIMIPVTYCLSKLILSRP